ncbi:integrase catalytic domain-containing protein [Trichonephila clavipes]|nr:integrase catalytic domain-containing protein [Trichonephila clavipes]
MARRGKCAKLFSNNGKNFVGASNEIKKLLEIVRKPDEKLANYLAAEGIEWKFIPARSPNFGGLWEAAIKSFKTLNREEGKRRGEPNHFVLGSPLIWIQRTRIDSSGALSAKRTFSENMTGRVFIFRCRKQARFGVEIKRHGSGSFTRTNGEGTWSGEPGANVYHPSVKGDEGRERALPLEFKGNSLE